VNTTHFPHAVVYLVTSVFRLLYLCIFIYTTYYIYDFCLILWTCTWQSRAPPGSISWRRRW